VPNGILLYVCAHSSMFECFEGRYHHNFLPQTFSSFYLTLVFYRILCTVLLCPVLLYFTFHCRLTIKARCPMHLRKFPLDSQSCPLLIGSCKYNYRIDFNTVHVRNVMHHFKIPSVAEHIFLCDTSEKKQSSWPSPNNEANYMQ